MFPLSLRNVLLFCLLAPAGVLAENAVHYKLAVPAESHVGKSSAEIRTFTQSDDLLVFHVSIQAPALMRSAWSEADWKGARLGAIVSREARDIPCSHAAFSSISGTSPGGSALRIDKVDLTFPAGSRLLELKEANVIALKIGAGTPLTVHVGKAEPHIPFSWAPATAHSTLDAEVRAAQDGAAIFPLHLRELRVIDHEIELRFAVENAHRLPVKWQGGINGWQARLVTRSGLQITPISVSDSIKTTLLPADKYMASGYMHEGWVRFPLVPEDECAPLTFLLPAYRPAQLSFDPATLAWNTSTQSSASSKADHLLDEQRTFTSLRIFFNEAVKLAVSGKADAYAALFDSNLREEQTAFVTQLAKVPVTNLQMDLDPRMNVVPDGKQKASKIKGVLRFGIEGLSEENESAIDFECDVQRTESAWRILALRYPVHTPFWLCGYTSRLASPHFMVFFPPTKDGKNQAELTARDLEKSYSAIEAEGLRLKNRYLAFSVARKEDFQRLTSRNPNAYAGIASMRHTVQDGKLINANRAIFINDPRFSFLDRLTKRQDHLQTVQHEVTHLALADSATPWTPVWLEEGLAMYFAGQVQRDDEKALRSIITPGLTIRNLSVIPYLGYGTPDQLAAIQAQYILSGVTVSWLVKNFGLNEVIRLHRSFAATIPDEWAQLRGTGKDQEKLAAARLRLSRRAVEKQFHLSLEQLDAAVKAAL